jgi:NAD(P)-dependent dehydrogenase (short-subunit alcohol dehydrogenase family)
MGMLDGRVVIVTGGGRGLGRSHCLELARHGATVVVNDLGVDLHGESAETSPAQDVVSEIESSGGTASADGTSVTDYQGVAGLVQRTVERYGSLDGVVNNAGIVRDRILASMSEEEFDSVVSVHLKGAFCLTRHACAYWRDRGKAGHEVSGRIVSTTSGAGLWGNFGQGNYGPAKAAIAGLTLVTAMEMERYGVTANAVSPLARTRMTAELPWAREEAPEGWDRYDPANTSPVVAWLCSAESGWLSGAVLRVNGDTVQPLQPWPIDDARSYRGVPGERLDATSLGHGLRTAFGVMTPGIPRSSGS